MLSNSGFSCDQGCFILVESATLHALFPIRNTRRETYLNSAGFLMSLASHTHPRVFFHSPVAKCCHAFNSSRWIVVTQARSSCLHKSTPTRMAVKVSVRAGVPQVPQGSIAKNWQNVLVLGAWSQVGRDLKASESICGSRNELVNYRPRARVSESARCANTRNARFTSKCD